MEIFEVPIIKRKHVVEIPSVLTGIVIEIVPVHQFWFLELGLLVIWLVGILVRCVYSRVTIIGR